MSKVDLPLVPLGKVAKPIVRPVNVLPGQSYRTLGVKWWGEGAYERETIDGSKTAANQLYEVHEGDLIINKIWVRHGSIGIVPATMHGCAGSGEFPTFDLDTERVLPRWIHWYSKTREMWGKCDALSQGTSGKNRIKPEKFLTVTLPLPPPFRAAPNGGEDRAVGQQDRGGQGTAGQISRRGWCAEGVHLFATSPGACHKIKFPPCFVCRRRHCCEGKVRASSTERSAILRGRHSVYSDQRHLGRESLHQAFLPDAKQRRVVHQPDVSERDRRHGDHGGDGWRDRHPRF